MASDEIQLDLTITEADADPERIEKLTRYLLRDLRELGVESVERPSSKAMPEGAKGDAFTLGALALAVLPAFLPKLVEFLQAWSLRGEESRKVKVKTPAGLEVEFTPERKLSAGEVAKLANKLAQAQVQQGSSGK